MTFCEFSFVGVRPPLTVDGIEQLLQLRGYYP